MRRIVFIGIILVLVFCSYLWAEDVYTKSGKRFVGTIMEQTDDGELVVKVLSGQGSHILSSMSKANCFIILPMECENLEANSTVTVQPFAGLI